MKFLDFFRFTYDAKDVKYLLGGWRTIGIAGLVMTVFGIVAFHNWRDLMTPVLLTILGFFWGPYNVRRIAAKRAQKNRLEGEHVS